VEEHMISYTDREDRLLVDDEHVAVKTEKIILPLSQALSWYLSDELTINLYVEGLFEVTSGRTYDTDREDRLLVDDEHVPGGEADLRARELVEEHVHLQLPVRGGAGSHADTVDARQGAVRLQ
jgi:hypothetical protein